MRIFQENLKKIGIFFEIFKNPRNSSNSWIFFKEAAKYPNNFQDLKYSRTDAVAARGFQPTYGHNLRKHKVKSG